MMLKDKWRYIVIIGIYLLGLLGVIGLIISLLLSSFKENSMFFNKINSGEAVVEIVLENQTSLGIILESDFKTYGVKNERFINHIYTHTENAVNYYFITNSYANIVTSSSPNAYLLEVDGKLVLKDDIATNIMNGSLTKWENNLDIKFATFDEDYFSYLPQFLLNFDEILISFISHYQKDSNGNYILDESNNRILNELVLPTSDYFALYQTLYYAFMFIPMLLLLLSEIKKDYKRMRERYTVLKYIGKILIYWLFLMIFIIGASVVNNIIVMLGFNTENAVNQLSLDRSSVGNLKWLMIFTIALMGPLVEEFVFRKAIF